MANIVRVFSAVVHPGKEEEFKSFFLNEAVSNVRKHKGLVSVQLGLPLEETPQQFLMTMPKGVGPSQLAELKRISRKSRTILGLRMPILTSKSAL